MEYNKDEQNTGIYPAYICKTEKEDFGYGRLYFLQTG